MMSCLGLTNLTHNRVANKQCTGSTTRVSRCYAFQSKRDRLGDDAPPLLLLKWCDVIATLTEVGDVRAELARDIRDIMWRMEFGKLPPIPSNPGGDPGSRLMSLRGLSWPPPPPTPPPLFVGDTRWLATIDGADSLGKQTDNQCSISCNSVLSHK